MKALLTSPMKIPASLSNGFYYGERSAYNVTFYDKGVKFQLELEEGIRGLNQPVLVKVDSGVFEIFDDDEEILTEIGGMAAICQERYMQELIEQTRIKDSFRRGHDFFTLLVQRNCNHVETRIFTLRENEPGMLPREWEEKVCRNCERTVARRLVTPTPGGWVKVVS